MGRCGSVTLSSSNRMLYASGRSCPVGVAGITCAHAVDPCEPGLCAMAVTERDRADGLVDTLKRPSYKCSPIRRH